MLDSTAIDSPTTSSSSSSSSNTRFSSSQTTAVNTAVHTRRNSFSHLTGEEPKHEQVNQQGGIGGVSPKQLAQKLLQQQSPTKKYGSDKPDLSESAASSPTSATANTGTAALNTLVSNTPRVSFDGKRCGAKNGFSDASPTLDLEKTTLGDSTTTLTSPIESVASAAPEGGLAAWLVVLGTFLMIMTNFGLLTSYGVFQSYYLSHQLRHISPSTVSWIGSLQTFLILGGSAIFGKISDDYGPRYILIIGSVLTFVSLFSVSFCHTFGQFLALQGICFGVGGSMLFLPGCSLIGQYFDKKRAFAMGIIIGAASFGGIIWPLLLSFLFNHPKIGFGWGTRIAALILLVLLTISNVLMKPRILPNKYRAQQQQRVHEEEKAEEGKVRAEWEVKVLPWSKMGMLLVEDQNFLIFVIGVAIMWMNFFVPFFSISSYAKAVGMGSQQASYTVAIMNGASLVGRLTSGWIADRYGRFNSLLVYGTLSAISLLLFWPIPGLTLTRAGVYTLSVTYGVFSGGSIAVVGACAAQISKRETAGAKLGIMWSAAAPGTLVGPVISAALVNAVRGHYWPLALWTASTTLLGTAVVAITRFRLAKGKWSVVV